MVAQQGQSNSGKFYASRFRGQNGIKIKVISVLKMGAWPMVNKGVPLFRTALSSSQATKLQLKF
jgi:hypothetical protein